MFQWDASTFATHAYSTFFILYNFAIIPYECSVLCEHMEKSVVAWNEKKNLKCVAGTFHWGKPLIYEDWWIRPKS